MKAWKIVIIVLILLLIAVGLTFNWLGRNSGRIAGEAITEAGNQLLDTTVSYEDVKLDLLNGKATIFGLRVANPEGYSDRPLLQLGDVLVDIDMSSLTSDILVIQNVRVTDPVVSYEVNADGVANVDVLQKKLGSEVSAAHGPGRKLIMESVIFQGGSITATAAQRPDQQLTFGFPSVTFTDLGAPDGAYPEPIGDEITEVLMARIIDAAKKAGVDSLVDTQKARLQEKASEQLKSKVDELKERLKGG